MRGWVIFSVIFFRGLVIGWNDSGFAASYHWYLCVLLYPPNFWAEIFSLVFPESTRGLGRIVFHLAPASSTAIRGVWSSFAAGGGNSKNLLKEPASFRLSLQTWTYKSNEMTEYMTYLKYSHIQLQGKASSARRRPYLFTFQGDGVFQRRHLQKMEETQWRKMSLMWALTSTCLLSQVALNHGSQASSFL